MKNKKAKRPVKKERERLRITPAWFTPVHRDLQHQIPHFIVP